MSYINYKKLSYILSEEPGVSGKIAFEFLNSIVDSNDVLKFTIFAHSNHNKSIESLIEMHDNIVILPNKTNERELVIKGLKINRKLLDVLCSLGEYPNFLKISKINSNLELKQIDYYWSIEYCDESFTFIYMDKYIDCSKITLIEQEFENKGISYERKREKSIKVK